MLIQVGMFIRDCRVLRNKQKNMYWILPVKTFLNQRTTSSQSKFFKNLQNKANISEQTLHI